MERTGLASQCVTAVSAIYPAWTLTELRVTFLTRSSVHHSISNTPLKTVITSKCSVYLKWCLKQPFLLHAWPCWRLISQSNTGFSWVVKNKMGKHDAKRGCFNTFIRAGEKTAKLLEFYSLLLFFILLCQEAAMGQNPVSPLHHWLALPQRTMKDIIKSNSVVYILY